MDKRHLHHTWTHLRPVKPWYFVAAAAVTGTVCVVSLRHNYSHMVQLRNAVYTADKNDTDVKGALTELRNYVYAHMNTNLTANTNAVYPPIQLKYTYERYSQQATEKATTSNQKLYTEAQAYCQKLNSTDFSGRNRVPCIEQYVTTHGVKIPTIPDSLYKFDFVSPVWSPDLAGWSMAATAVLLVTAVGLWFAEHWLRRRVA